MRTQTFSSLFFQKPQFLDFGQEEGEDRGHFGSKERQSVKTREREKKEKGRRKRGRKKKEEGRGKRKGGNGSTSKNLC